MALVKKINFQPSNATVPTGYTADSGEAYGVRADGSSFGWVRQDNLSSPLNIGTYGRDRNVVSDQRVDTLLHMQTANTPAAAWEYALPNGKYSVSVSAGDPTFADSTHRIRVEGKEAIRPFQPSSLQKFDLSTTTVDVTDGKLTIDAVGGTNTKINYLEIYSVSSGNHPSVPDSFPRSRASGVYRDAAAIADVRLPTSGAGVNASTLAGNVQLYRTADGAIVPGNANTTGGGDAIVFQPSQNLDANTNYTFRIGEGVKDTSGASFLPFSTTFTTGTATVPPTGVSVNKTVVYGADGKAPPLSSLLVSPNGKLYAAGLDGSLRRWNISSNGSLTDEQIFNDKNSQLKGRAIIGIAFNPNIPDDLYLWTSNNDPVPAPGSGQVANDFSGKVSKLSLSGTNFEGIIDDFVVGLPRATRDHLSNSLVYGPDNRLYMTQGSNSAMGAPDNAWGNRPERLLSAAVLRIDQYQFETRPAGGFNVQSEDYTLESGPNAGKKVTNLQGNYNPNDSKWGGNAPVKIFASGIRNAYDLVWHSNGNLYVPANGSAAGGNTPDNPNTSANEALTNVATQNDYLFKISSGGGGYYGHPNPKRGQYILNGGNPTSGEDTAEVIKPFADSPYNGYSVGTQPDPNYKGIAYDFGRNRSPNGVIEYKSNKFGGALKGKLLVTEYSGGDDILALTPDSSGNIPRGSATKLATGFTDPLDIIEDTKKNLGNLYVAELLNNGAAGRITLLS